MKKLLLLAIVVLGISAVSFGQQAATATVTGATVSTTIIAPITLANPVSLSFGTVGALAGTSTVILAADGSRGGTATTFTGGAPATAASFDVTGTPTASFVITKPAEGTLVKKDGAPDMTITNWTTSVPLTTAIGSDGTLNFKLTGTLNVGASATQTPGIYTGTYNVTVAYN